MCNYNAYMRLNSKKKKTQKLHNKKKVGKNKTGAEYTRIVRGTGYKE